MTSTQQKPRLSLFFFFFVVGICDSHLFFVFLCFFVYSFCQAVDRLSAQLAGRLNFQYSDPVKNFDRSKVRGLVAKLVDVKDPVNSTALEVAAGGKLYQARRVQ